MLEKWQVDVKAVRERIYGAPTAWEQERWQAVKLIARDLPAAQVATELERNMHTIGDWVEALREK